jgi:hypothetical protein
MYVLTSCKYMLLFSPMRTSMNIPRELLEEAMRESEASSQTMAVVMGLQELIRKKRMERLLALRGTDAVELTDADRRRQRRR